LSEADFVLCADEKTSNQAHHHKAPTTAPARERSGRIKHEYERKWVLTYIAAWDVCHARIFGCAARPAALSASTI
jgi:hypothetical protein